MHVPFAPVDGEPLLLAPLLVAPLLVVEPSPELLLALGSPLEDADDPLLDADVPPRGAVGVVSSPHATNVASRPSATIEWKGGGLILL